MLKVTATCDRCGATRSVGISATSVQGIMFEAFKREGWQNFDGDTELCGKCVDAVKNEIKAHKKGE